MTKRTSALIETLQGQHLSLPVAAHLARTQLVTNPHARYDGEHLLQMVEAVARALARSAPLYVLDGDSRRELSQAETDGATVSNGGSVLVLKGGRKYTSASIKRADLRQAIAILKTVGVPGLGAPAEKPDPSREPQPARGPARVLAQLEELEALLRLPLIAPQVKKASSLAVHIARGAHQGRIANLAMLLVSAMHEARGEDVEEAQRVGVALARLRAAVEAENAKS